MKRVTYFLSVCMIAMILLTINACKKTEEPARPEQVHFMGANSGSYTITAPGVVYKIPIGLTTTSGSSKTIRVSVTSKTGALEGTHYSLNTKTLTIPAGKAIDTIVVSGVFAQYQGGRKDTLVFTVEGDGVAKSTFNNTFTLVMRGPCFEGEISDPGAINAIRGTYANTREDWGGGAYGPYTTTISAATLTSSTTATITVTNIFDFGWGPITFNLDWTNINDRKITLVQQTGIAAASTAFGAGQAGTIQVGPHAQVGTFTYCNQVLTLRMRIGVTGAGYNPDLYEVILRR